MRFGLLAIAAAGGSLGAPAWANPPSAEVGVHGLGGAGIDRIDARPMLGGGAFAAIRTGPSLAFEARVDALTGQTGVARVGATAGARLAPLPRARGLSVLAAGGASWAPSPGPLAMAGLGIEPRPHAASRVRFELLGATTGAEAWAMGAVGWVFGARAKRPQAASTVPDAAMVWVPGPVCQWLPPDQAAAEIRRLGLRLASVHAIADRGSRGASPATESRVGQVLIAVWEGDQVWVDGEPIPVSEGLASTALPDGEAQVQVQGGGRTFASPLGLAGGHTVWLAVDPPTAARVRFEVGQSELRGGARAAVAELATQAGDWHFQVAGSTSPEGSVAENLRLAQARAEAVRQALVEAGVPAERVQVGEPIPPDPGLPAAEQRGALIQPLPPP